MYIYLWNQQHFILQELEGSADAQAKHGTGRLARFLRAPGMGFTNLYRRGGGAQLVLGFAQNGSQQIDTNKFPVDSPAWKINNHGFSKSKVDMYKFMWKCYKILLAT